MTLEVLFAACGAGPFVAHHGQAGVARGGAFLGVGAALSALAHLAAVDGAAAGARGTLHVVATGHLSTFAVLANFCVLATA